MYLKIVLIFLCFLNMALTCFQFLQKCMNLGFNQLLLYRHVFENCAHFPVFLEYGFNLLSIPSEMHEC
uniref:Uncharacterized protein n=1 Tax=Rhizophora mucronata TaxID=61149 RepID=A0A2P2Q7W6_RHIMU